METRRVFIVGDTLFAETLARILERAPALVVIGSAPSPEAALKAFATARPDVVIVTGAGDPSPADFGLFLDKHPDLPIIRADLGADDVRVITSQRVAAHASDLVAAIASLPKRS